MKRQKIRPRKEDDGLHPGISRELSPLWDFYLLPAKSVWSVLRYGHIAQCVCELTDWKRVEGQRVRLLDVGCGNAEMYQWMRGVPMKRGSRFWYTGIEGDPDKITRIFELLRKKNGLLPDRVHIRKYDLSKGLPNFRHHYDVAICSEVIEHLYRPEGVYLLSQMADRANYLIATVPTPAYGRDNQWHMHEWEPSELKRVVNEFWEVEFMGSINARWTGAGPGHHRFMGFEPWRSYAGMTDPPRAQGTINFVVARSRK